MDKIDLFKEFSGEEGINPKIFPDLQVAYENLENTQVIINLINGYNLSYNPDSLDARVLTMDADTLKSYLDLYKEAGYLKYFENDISKLRFNASKIIDRIKSCEKAGKGFYNEEGLCSFLFNTAEWNAVLNGLDTTVVAATIENVFGDNAQAVTSAISSEGELDINGFDRYWRLTQLMERCMEAKFGISDIGESEQYIRNLISNSDLNDNDILLATFVNSNCIKSEEVEELKGLIDEVVESELKESNGVAL